MTAAPPTVIPSKIIGSGAKCPAVARMSAVPTHSRIPKSTRIAPRARLRARLRWRDALLVPRTAIGNGASCSRLPSRFVAGSEFTRVGGP